MYMKETVSTPATRSAAKRTRPAPTKAATRKPASKPMAKTAKASAKVAGPAKPAKVKKPKLVRDSFTIPKDEYGALAELKQRCSKLDRPAKKSELLRAGIKALAGLNDSALLSALKAVPSIKTGRPAKG